MRTKLQRIMRGLLLATLAATVWTASQEELGDAAIPAVAPVKRARPAGPAVVAGGAPAELGLRQVWREPEPGQLLAWQPAPSQQLAAPPVHIAAASAADSPPSAPPFPFQMIGRMADLQSDPVADIAVLSNGSRVLNAKPGDTIDGQWRVDEVGAAGLRLTWLPGQQSQSIAFKSTP